MLDRTVALYSVIWIIRALHLRSYRFKEMNSINVLYIIMRGFEFRVF